VPFYVKEGGRKGWGKGITLNPLFQSGGWLVLFFVKEGGRKGRGKGIAINPLFQSFEYPIPRM